MQTRSNSIAERDSSSKIDIIVNLTSRYAVEGVMAVSLAHIEPASADVDEWLWVIIGDLPPAYLVVDNSPDPPCALESYIELMEEWVDKVKAGESTDDCIPVNVEPTLEWASELELRLDFLKENILNDTRDGLA
jgi:hypothetical protein